MSLLCIMVPVCCMYSLYCKLDLPVVIDFMYLIMILLLVKLFFLSVYFQCVVAKVDADAEKELGSKYLSPNYITILIRINNWPESYLMKHGHQIIPITFCNFSFWLSVHMLLILIISLNRKIILSTF